jgi:aryl-alcohol dehydrogenase-like predicted oxidoreductase
MVNSRLILGGHSFIAQLGSDPAPDEKTQDAIVSACLDSGITVFDTTCQPERVALGSALKRLGRRDEAELIAWNFFVSFGPNDPVSGHHAYESQTVDSKRLAQWVHCLYHTIYEHCICNFIQ